MKSVQIRSFFWFIFSRIRTEYGEISQIRTEYGEIRSILFTLHISLSSCQKSGLLILAGNIGKQAALTFD